MSSFHVDGRIGIKLEYELAVRLGKFILDCRTEDKQLAALGHKLVNLDEEESAPDWENSQPSIVSEWNEPSAQKTLPRQSIMREKVAKAKVSWGMK